MIAIIRRELINVFRSKTSFAMQVGLGLIFALLVVLRWPTEGQVDLANSTATEVFRIFGYGLLIVLVLMAPAFPATSVVREKNKGTLALLFNSMIPPWRIYLGKLIGVCGFLFLLLILSLPAAAACMSMGGISFYSEFLPLYGVLGLLSLHYAVLGLWISCRATSADSSLKTTYFVILTTAVVSLVPYLLLQGSDSIVTQLAWWLRSLSPIPAVMEILGDGDVGNQGINTTEGTLGAAGRFMLVAGVTTLALICDTLARFNHRLFDKPRSQELMADDMDGRSQIVRRMFFIVDPQRRKSGILPFFNPVLIKEFRTRKFGRSHWLLRIISLCAITSMILAFMASQSSESWGPEIIGGIMVLLQAGLIVLFTPSLAAGLISGEIESGGWQLLQMTPMSAWRIVLGKLLSVIWTMAIVLSATLPGYLVLAWIVPEKSSQIYQVLICLLWASFFSVFVSAAISSLFRKTAPATVTAYAVLSAMYVITLFVWLFRGKPFGHRVVENVLSINPIAAAMQVIETPGFETFDLVRSNWVIMGVGCMASLVLLIVQTYRLTQPR